MLLRSTKLAALAGVRHAFSTRLGGVSEGPYATLNLGRSVGDVAERVEENQRRFERLAGLDAPVRQSSQVHGTAVVDALAHGSSEALRHIEADGIYVSTPRVALGVRTADCAPLLFAATRGDGLVGAVSAVHAGWRGATGGILRETLARFLELGFSAASLTVAIGPTIGPAAFEVGPEVIAAATASLSGRAPPAHTGPSGRPHLDLAALLVWQLEALGVPPHAIEQVGGCTMENEAMFFSHRRDRGTTGRHLSAIAFGHAP
jgi:YfiH family protein